MEYTVNHYPDKHRFEVVEDGLTAYVEYRLRGDALDIIHTIVPKPLEGRGIAATLVETAYKYAKEQLSSGNRADTYTGDLGGSEIDPFQRGPVKLRLY